MTESAPLVSAALEQKAMDAERELAQQSIVLRGVRQTLIEHAEDNLRAAFVLRFNGMRSRPHEDFFDFEKPEAKERRATYFKMMQTAKEWVVAAHETLCKQLDVEKALDELRRARARVVVNENEDDPLARYDATYKEKAAQVSPGQRRRTWEEDEVNFRRAEEVMKTVADERKAGA